MKEKLALFIENNLEKKKPLFQGIKVEKLQYSRMMPFHEYEEARSIDSYIDDNKSENRFQTLLFKYIDERNLNDSDVYNKVHIDRRLFSKIRNDINYHPSKETIILLGLSLNLNINELLELLESASYSLPKNNYYDLIIRFCFIEKIYDLKEVNDLLALYNCKMFNY